MFFCLTHHQNDSRTVIYWTSAMTGLSATWRHTRGLKSGGLSPLIGKFKLPQKAWGMNKLSSNLQKKIGMFCWNFAMIGMIGMVFGYLQKNVKLSLSLSLSSPKKNWSSCASKLFCGTCHVSDEFVGPETLLKNIQWNAAQPVWARLNGGGVEDLWEPLTHRKADLVLNVFNQ